MHVSIKDARVSPHKVLEIGPGHDALTFAWPLLGAGFCIFIAAYSAPTFDLTTNVVGIGSIAIGIVPYLSNRSRVFEAAAPR